MVRLVRMNPEQFSKMRDRRIVAYAVDMIRIGEWARTEAEQRSREEVDGLLPGGLSTPDQYLMEILTDEGTEAGAVWFGVRRTPTGDAGFIHWLEVFAQFRGRGYGKEALSEVEEILSEKGVHRLGVNVFANEPAAVALYQHTGYQTVSCLFEKPLPPPLHF